MQEFKEGTTVKKVPGYDRIITTTVTRIYGDPHTEVFEEKQSWSDLSKDFFLYHIVDKSKRESHIVTSKEEAIRKALEDPTKRLSRTKARLGLYEPKGKESGYQVGWHITPKSNLKKILREGLIPGRSESLEGERGSQLFFWTESAGEALKETAGWVGREIAILRVEIPNDWIHRTGESSGFGEELVIERSIPPEFIKAVTTYNPKTGRFSGGSLPKYW